ncbi:MAG TPA: TlpA disulfide reductase family protein [Beijerinckiaceae bacterium]|nr:TlpA disulfide reductase family protein [Beijerinckiaceae bacterium]
MTPAPTQPTRSRVRAPLTVAVLTLAILCVAVLYGIGRGPRKEEASAGCPGDQALLQKLVPSAQGAVAALALLPAARSFPNVAFQGPHNEPRHLADFKGKFVLLNLWATWCIPCRQEMPSLDKLQASLGSKRFEVVAVSVDTERLNRRRAFLKQIGVRSLQFYGDPSAEILRVLKQAGPVVGLPTSFLIDPQGCELGVMAGPADWGSKDATRLISAALDQAPTQRGPLQHNSLPSKL